VKWGEDRLDKIKEGKSRAAADRQRLVERLKSNRASAAETSRAPEPRRRRCEHLSVDAAMAAAERLRFMNLSPSVDIDVGPREALNRPTQALLRSFLTTLVSGRSHVLLQWPFGQRDVSVIHPLAMLSLLFSPTARTTEDHIWCDAVPDFRTLYFPWRGGGTGVAQRAILVDRFEVIRQNSRHLTRRRVSQPEASPELGKLHETLGHLSRLSLRDSDKPHLAHPTLAEIYSTFIDDGASGRLLQQPAAELFGRVRYGAALDQLRDYRPEICQPRTAPFALFGISSRSNLKQVLDNPILGAEQPDGRRPDIILLDLGPPALTRLGHGWDETVESFLREASARFPEVPVLAVTQDGYVQRRVTRMISALKGRDSDAVGSSVLVRLSDDLLTADPPIEAVSPITARVHAAAGDASEAIRALSEAARGAADSAIGGLLLRGIGNIRRALALPCGLGVAYDMLCEADGQEAANIFLERRSAATVLAPLQRAISSGASGPERGRFMAADEAVRRAFDALDRETPIGSLLVEFMRQLVRKSSRSIIVFGSDTDRMLAERRLAADEELGPLVSQRLRTRHIVFTTSVQLEAELHTIEALPDRNRLRRLVFVAPTSEAFARVVARQWLPNELVLLCDRSFAVRIAATHRGLGSHPDLAGADRIGGRLAAIAAAAQTEADARAVGAVDLELEARPVMLPSEDVVDLTVGDDDDTRELVIFSLQSGRTLRARPGSVIVRHRRDAEINPFERSIARDITEGASILVPDQSFVEEARRVLPVEVLARSWVTVYHNAVEAVLPQVAGDTLAAKARTLMAAMRPLGARDMSQAAVVDWIRVAEHKLLPPERLRPHAPQRKREFDAFMSVLGLSGLADKVWLEGVEQLRSDRRQAGVLMARAFVSVLVDPHGAASGLDPDTKRKIAALRKKALDHLDAVIGREIHQNKEGQVA
jgi:hypothetical protein